VHEEHSCGGLDRRSLPEVRLERLEDRRAGLDERPIDLLDQRLPRGLVAREDARQRGTKIDGRLL